MQTEAVDRRMQRDRDRRMEAGQSRAEPRGTQRGALRNSEENKARVMETFTSPETENTQDQEEAAEGRGGRNRSRGDGGRGRGKEARSWGTASGGGDGGEQADGLRRRVHQLEKEKLELMWSQNQELCGLQAELTRLRSSVERGEAQRVELQYELAVSQRDATRVPELSRDKQALTERAAELQLKLQELQKALEITRQAREEDQHALQQEVEERDRLIQSFSAENQRLHRLLQDQEEALEEAERRMMEVLKEKEREAEANRRQAEELKYVREREERSRKEKEVSDHRVKSLESNMEAERAAHLESKVNSEIIQLRVRDVEAALAVERCGHQEAQSSLELLRAEFREVERVCIMEKERSNSTERALHSLQREYEQSQSELSAALEAQRKVTSDLRETLEEEKKSLADALTLLEQATQRQSSSEQTFVHFIKIIRETLQGHDSTEKNPPAKDDGSWSPSAEVLQLLRTTLSSCRDKQKTTEKQVQDLLSSSERLHEDNQTLRQLTSDQSRQVEELQQRSITLEEEVTRLRQESSDWSGRSRDLGAELEREKEEREKERVERRREMDRLKEDMTMEVQKILEHYEEESKVRLSFFYRLYQRLLAGRVLLDQPHSILGNFTWEELCDVISEQVDQLTSDLKTASEKVVRLQTESKQKSVCVRQLQRSHEVMLSRLEETVRGREAAWSRRHADAITGLQDELQLCGFQCDSLREHASSLELRLSSLTSDLSRSREESASFLSACALLAGALRHAHRRLHVLGEQKTLLSRRLREREELEEEVRRLAAALGGEEEEEEQERRRRIVRRWRTSMFAVMAVRRWRELANQTTALFWVERGGGASACVNVDEDDGEDEGREAACARWLRSVHLSSIVLTSTSDLQGALRPPGSAPLHVTSAARSALSRLLDHLLDQSEASKNLLPGRLDEDKENNVTSAGSHMKALVSTLQQHFLVFSQRLHSSEVERRSLRLEVSNLKRGLKREKETVPAERFLRVCEELHEALSREQEAQTLLQAQTLQLQLRPSETPQEDPQVKALSKAQQEVSRRERSLRILGKHLSGVHREKKKLEEKLQRVEDELRNRCKGCFNRNAEAAETNKKVSLIPKTSLRSDLEAPGPAPLSDSSKELPVNTSTSPSKTNPAPPQQSPAPSPAHTKTPRAKRKEKKVLKKTRAGRK